jgi:hypothetical protein
MGQDSVIIVAHPLCSTLNRNPPIRFCICIFIDPQNMFGVLGPNEHPRIIKDGGGLLLVSIDVVDMFRRRFDGTSGVISDPCGGDWFCSGSQVRGLVGIIQGTAEMVGLGLGPHVKPTNNEGKEVRPHGHDGITRISGDCDEMVEIYERVHDGKQKCGNYPDNVHRHGDRPLPCAFGRYRKDLPVSIVLNQGWKKRTRGIDPERDVLEGGKSERDMILVGGVEVGELTCQPFTVETGDGK